MYDEIIYLVMNKYTGITFRWTVRPPDTVIDAPQNMVFKLVV